MQTPFPRASLQAEAHQSHLGEVAHAIDGVLGAAALQVQPSPVQVHLHGSVLAWQPSGDAHGGWQVDLHWKRTAVVQPCPSLSWFFQRFLIPSWDEQHTHHPSVGENSEV